LFHDAERKARLDIDPNEARREANREQARRESVAEELRVVYVALTRAKHRVSVFWGNFRDLAASAAAEIFHPEPPSGRKPCDPQRLSKRSDAELLSDLERLAAESGGAIGVRRIQESLRGEPYQVTRSVSKVLAARQLSSRVRPRRRTDSFSSLTQNEARLGSEDADERDHDQDALREELAERAPKLELEPVPEPRERILLDGFPHGAHTGNFFHEILEEIDFKNVTRPVLEDVVAKKLSAFGLVTDLGEELRSRYREQSVLSIESALTTPLVPATTARLCDVPLERRRSELEFRLPVALSASGRAHERERLTSRRLALAFSEHRSDAIPRFYADRVARLGFQGLRGFLKGYVDLVFEHDGKWFVVDYKTNHLGDFVDEYRGERVTLAMAHSHYFLQYHLYALAVDRYLRCFQPGYAYEQHFGGVLYLFLKGMRPNSVGTGVFFEKPPLARLEALSLALEGAAP
jgi:exodeoxyribonuclease V beta subunit